MFEWIVVCALIAANMEGNPMQIKPLAQDHVVVYESPDAQQFYAYSPGIARLESGRIIATMDQGGPGTKDLVRESDGRSWRGRVYTSDDHGATWTHCADTPLEHARPFEAGGAVYIVGQDDDLGIVRSNDGGETWSEPAWFTQGQRWHQAPCNVWYTRERVYLVMERITDTGWPGWPVAVCAPVVMAADASADLTKRENWTFSNEFNYNDAIAQAGKPNLLGVPFYEPGSTPPQRSMAPPGWLETNIVQFAGPDHVWHDPRGRTFHLLMRAHTGATNLACIAKAVEKDDGSIEVGIESAPSGEPMLYVPMPGGQMKFHILYDEETKLFWLLSTQATDSMTRPEKLGDERYGLPNNERHRLALHFSKNCVDWVFAGLVANSGAYGQGRHYASMVIDGDNLLILSRSGDARAQSAHDGNLITLHTVKDFRGLAY